MICEHQESWAALLALLASRHQGARHHTSPIMTLTMTDILIMKLPLRSVSLFEQKISEPGDCAGICACKLKPMHMHIHNVVGCMETSPQGAPYCTEACQATVVRGVHAWKKHAFNIK